MSDEELAINFAIAPMIQGLARRTPEAMAIVASGREPLTYLGLASQVDRVRKSLNENGVGRGDRVAIMIGNGPEMAVAFLGVAAAATAAPLNPTYTAAEFEFYLSDLGIGALIVEAGRDTPARPVAERLGIAVIELASRTEGPAGVFELRGGRTGSAKRPGVAETAEVALILHTSGTTSRPKIVPLTHRNLLTSARNFADWYALEPGDRTLAVMPFFHIQGVVGAALAPLTSGGSIACAREFDPDSFFALMDEFGPTWYTAGPTFHQAIVARASRYGDVIRRHPLRFIRSSSAPLAPQTMSELERVFGAPVLEGYGLTESCLHSVSNPLPPRPRKPGCVGLPAGIAVAIMDQAGTLLGAGEMGEVVLRGPTLTAGYDANPEANAAAFADGWFRTGDQGRFDADGYLTLTGRLKELINRGGEKIAPVEIDHVLLDHPDVKQAVAFSIPHPNLGEEVGAAVVLREGANVGETEIRAFAAKTLAPFKVPRRVVFVDSIPKSTVGKSLRPGLAEKLGISYAAPMAPKELAAAGGARRPGPMEAALIEIWRSALLRNEIGVDDDFFSLGGDSLQATQVILEVQSLFGIELSPELMFSEASSIAGMAAEIVRRRDEKAPAEARLTPLAARAPQFLDHLTPGESGLTERAGLSYVDPTTGLRRAKPNAKYRAIDIDSLGYPELFARYPIEVYFDRLDAMPNGAPYHRITPAVAALWREILDRYGPEGLETYNRVTMLALMDAFEERAAGRNYPESIIDQYQLSFARIEKTIAEAEIGTYPHTSDIFLKDFAICRQKAFPAGGAQIVDEYHGFSRASLLSGGFGQFFRFLFLLLFVTRGNAPFYVTHTHLSVIEEFTPEERDGCYARIAEMLERHPEMKGWFNVSWYDDPALEKISPRLAYLRQRPQENGAWVFRVGEDIDGGALTNSVPRRKLYEEGKYVPTTYLVVWPRRKMIAWAKRL